MSSIEFSVSIPSQDGWYGRECNASNCRRYFKIHEVSFQEQMHCPYCGTQFSSDELWTREQLGYIDEVAEHEVTRFAEEELDKIFKKIARRSKNISYKPGRKLRPSKPRPPQESEVDSELECPTCDTKFQVFGIFGYCPGCGSENLLLYDANLAIIRQEVASSRDEKRALRHAYGDLVSTFETFCRKEAIRCGVETGRFQNLDHTRRLFKKELSIDIFGSLEDPEKRLLKRVFEKRHVHDHNHGIVSERYVKQIPEDASLLGKEAPLSVEELVAAGDALRKALMTLVDARV